MQIAPLGLDYGTKKLIFEPIDKNELIELIARYVGTVDFRRETDSFISKGMERADILERRTKEHNPNSKSLE